MNLKTKTAYGLIFLMLILSVFVSGCLTGSSGNESNLSNTTDGEGVVAVATYYIPDLNEEKVSDAAVLDTLVKTIHQFDIIAVQGIEDPDEKAMETLMKAVNNGTDENKNPYYYRYNLSGPTGPDSEQYAFIYNRDVVYPASIPRTYTEPHGDTFENNPYMLVFRAHEGTGDILFVNVHISENNTAEEINELATLVDDVKKVYAGQTNITILGNFNADEPYYNNSSASSPLKSDEFYWAATDEDKSTADGKAYDKIVITQTVNSHFIGLKGVYNITEEYNLTIEQTKAVSSHYPVYAEFWRFAPKS